jgi:DNA-binding NarL/FixJ family response regulator
VPIRLVLADDHPMMLAGLEQLLGLERDFVIVAKCTNGEEALQSVCDHQPDVLVLDLQMPGKHGLAVLRELQSKRLPTRTVILTAALDEDEVIEAMRLGVRGIVLKHMAPRLLVECIRAVHAVRAPFVIAGDAALDAASAFSAATTCKARPLTNPSSSRLG